MKLALMMATVLIVVVPGADALASLDGPASGLQSATRIANATSTREAPSAPTIPTAPTAPLAGEVQQVLDLVNAERTSRGLVPLRINPLLTTAASAHSAAQAAAGSIFHVAPDGSGPGERISATGYLFNTWGENVAAGYRDADAVMAGWMKSPGHCKNILNPAFTELGVGYARREGDPSRFFDYWTQAFARPAGEQRPPGTYDPAWC